MMYERVMVRKRPRDRFVYLCRYDRIKDSPGILLHCGACERGIVLPKKGDRCRVCGARVINVEYGRTASIYMTDTHGTGEGSK